MKSSPRPKLFTSADGHNYLWPFVLVTSLFFLWGFAHGILEVLNPHFQATMQKPKAEAALVQAVVYGGYFLMALPAGALIRRHGYRTGVLTGLILYGLGALLFIPGGRLQSFPFFLFSLFIIGCGLTCLETAANPYVTVLGRPEGAARRINLSQSLNGLGWIVGPLVGTWFLFARPDGDITMPYALIGIVVWLIALIFSRVRLPEISSPADTGEGGAAPCGRFALLRHRPFLLGLTALFFYVAAQTGINSFFVNYVTERLHLSTASAGFMLSIGGMGLFVLGRMGGSWIMSRIRAERVLLVCAIGAALAMCVLLTGAGTMGLAAFFVCYLCESIMFPTIFALALRDALGATTHASSLLIMSIVGGAIAPVIMGLIADAEGTTATAFAVPLACFVIIAVYALQVKGSRLYD